MTMVFLSLTLIKLLLVSIAPLFIDISYYQVFIDYNYNSPWYMNLIFNQSYLLDLSRTLIIGYCSTAIMAILCFIALRKRIRHVNFFLKIALILIWPFFLGIQFIIDIHALFVRNLEWKTIPHKDKTNISSINKSGNQM